jgi:predicted RND superfamily exporter protein
MNRTKENLGPNTDVLETSTSRAVLFSALTTIISFGILSFMHHAGTASMGKLLTICISFMIISTLLVLPALLKIYKPYKQQDPS